MGSENLFRKRKERLATDFARTAPSRIRPPRLLIVCEGTKTEPQYLSELSKDRQQNTPIVVIARNQGVSPDKVLTHARLLSDEARTEGDAYDYVFCVFDRDEHSTFSSTLDTINTLGKPYAAITSTPCFEFWLLLHFACTDAPFARAGKKSMGDIAVTQLKKQASFKGYKKGQTGLYLQLKANLPQALNNAHKIRKNANPQSQQTANPWTNMDKLVKVMRVQHSKNIINDIDVILASQ